ncbi:hypothetical protein ACQVP2_34875, partial [Methylobacterium aquaticum]|uniref:hypothetical protein n=1 Tax=Methylobacterium aquaticum TaxID=270351 RepID=UPI003D17347E
IPRITPAIARQSRPKKLMDGEGLTPRATDGASCSVDESTSAQFYLILLAAQFLPTTRALHDRAAIAKLL